MKLPNILVKSKKGTCLETTRRPMLRTTKLWIADSAHPGSSRYSSVAHSQIHVFKNCPEAVLEKCFDFPNGINVKKGRPALIIHTHYYSHRALSDLTDTVKQLKGYGNLSPLWSYDSYGPRDVKLISHMRRDKVCHK